MQKRSDFPIIFYPKSEETKQATLDALLSCNISLCKQGQQRGRHHMAMAMAWERALAEVSRCLPALQQGPELFGILCMLKMGQASKQVAAVRRGHLDERNESVQSQRKTTPRVGCVTRGVRMRQLKERLLR